MTGPSETRFLDRDRAVLARFQLPGQHLTDPLTIATEGALYAVEQGDRSPLAIGFNAMKVLPARATQFERGLAMGIALCLATERSGTPTSGT